MMDRRTPSAKAETPTSQKRREQELEKRLDPARLPAHLAIIMDGNGRWARKHGWRDRIRGHEAGIKSVREIVESCAELGLKTLTLYAFSRENWQRPRHETTALMHLLRRFLMEERPNLKKNNIRLIAVGCLDDLPAKTRSVLEKTRELTAQHTGLTLNLALSYSGREEIAAAARLLARKVGEGALQPDDITPEALSAHLYAPELGDPDLLIRTSGELRISNFLLWQLAYTEIHVTDVLWPDFRRAHLLEALLDFQNRERRFGRVGETNS